MLCRQLLESIAPAEAEPQATVKLPACALPVMPTRVCPRCGAGRMIVIEELFPSPMDAVAGTSLRVVLVDSS